MSLEIVSRARWGAKYKAGAGARALPTSEGWLHHTVTLAPDLAFRDLNADAVDDDEAAAMRTIERIGQQRFGQGFSYNLAIMPSGRVYEGCGVDRVGAHTAGRNTRAFGLALVGDYSRVVPPQAMQDSIVAVLQDGKRLGWLDAAKLDGGHRDLKSTSCPGAKAYALIGALNKRAAGAPVKVAPVAARPAGSQVRPPAFPLAAGQFFGPEGGGRDSISGYHGHREDLRRWQAQMRERGWAISVDGLYGPKGAKTPKGQTADVARAFQREKRLVVDGLIGQATWAAAWAAKIT